MARILIIDDDSQIRFIVRELLENSGYTVEEASDGEEAINLNHKKAFDLIITDILMPGKEGIQTIQEFKKGNPKVKIIAISGGGHIGPSVYLDMAKKMGADVSIPKPFDLDIFLKKVKDLLKK